MNKHTMFLIVGETSSGKDTLVQTFCQGRDCKQLISYTTRPRRKDEGDTHIFISPEEVEQYKDQMIAYTKIGDFEYFATKSQLYENDFYIIDYRGIEYMRELTQNLNDIRFVTIFIHSPREVRKARALYGRNDNELAFYKRCFNESEQFNEMLLRRDYDYSISNVDFNRAYDIFEYIVLMEQNTPLTLSLLK